MSIETDLVTQLKANTDLTNLVGTRIYPLKAPQNVVNPYVIYRVISDVSNQCLGGVTFENDARFQIDCWSTKYSEVKAIKEAVLNAIEGFKSSYGINVMDDYEDETLLYRQLIDFKLKG